MLKRVRGVPLAGEALRFAPIFRGHQHCDYVATSYRVLSQVTGHT